MPKPAEVWELSQRVLRARYRRSLSDEEIDEFAQDVVLKWIELSDEYKAAIQNWKAFVRRTTINRVLDHFEKRSNRRRLREEQGMKERQPRPDDDGTEERPYSSSGGMVPDSFVDPVAEAEFRAAHRAAFEQLTEVQQVVLSTYAASKKGELPAGVTPEAYASAILDKDPPWSSNGFAVQVSRAGEKLEELLGKYDPEFDDLYERRRSGLQGKRAARAFREADLSVQAVLSVHAQVKLGELEPARAAEEAGLRADRNLSPSDFEDILMTTLDDWTKGGSEPWFRPAEVWRRIADEWKKQNPAKGPQLKLIRGGADEEKS